MEKKWRETFLSWAKTDIFQQRVAESRKTIFDALKKYKKAYISFSGGKDSTCVLHLVLQQKPDILVVHWDFGPFFIPREIEGEIQKNMRILGARNIRIETSQKYKELKRKARNVLGVDFLGKFSLKVRKKGFRAVFLGLRKEESSSRKLRITHGKNLTSLQELCPIQNWKWLDVWAYIVSNDLPYLSHYDRYASIVGWDRARFTTFFDPEFDKFGCRNVDGVLMWQFKHYDLL